MKYTYVVQVLLEAPDRWYDLCECVTPDAAAAVVLALLATGGPVRREIKCLVRETPYV